jgi:hypothetical protein
MGLFVNGLEQVLSSKNLGLHFNEPTSNTIERKLLYIYPIKIVEMSTCTTCCGLRSC